MLLAAAVFFLVSVFFLFLSRLGRLFTSVSSFFSFSFFCAMGTITYTYMILLLLGVELLLGGIIDHQLYICVLDHFSGNG